MMVRRLSAVDAQMHWMSAKIPNDQFLLYGFAGVPSDLEQAPAMVRARAAGCPELRLRVRDQWLLSYPSWTAGEVGPDQVVLRDLTDSSWAAHSARNSVTAKTSPNVGRAGRSATPTRCCA